MEAGGISMVPEERRKQILDTLESRGYMTVEELARALFVSVPTVRRDLTALERENSVRRTHGGATYVDSRSRLWPLELRSHVQSEAKRRIGRLAAGLVQDGDMIFIDSSSTSLCLAEALRTRKTLKVVTNSLPVAQLLGEAEGVDVELPGGYYHHQSGSVFGDDACDFIARRFAKYSFISCAALDVNSGATNMSRLDISVKHAFQRQAQRLVLLADHTKIGVTKLYQVFSMREIDILVTDRPLPEDVQARCDALNITVIFDES